MTEAFTGKGIDRVDGRLKVTGKAPYAAEIPVANAAHAVIVTSPVACGRITEIDARAAEKAPGVLAVLTHQNAPKLPGATKKTSPQDRVLQVLQDDQVLYGDQPIALVVADTLERAEHAATLVSAKIDAAPCTVDIRSDRAHTYTPGPTPQGAPDSSRGDVEKGLAAAAVRVEQTYTTPTETHNPMEMHATTAVWQGPDRLTVYDSTQGIFGVRRRLAAVFGLDADRVRVISPFVGGGFGCKGSTWSHVVLAAMAAKVVGRGVNVMVTRTQMFSLVGHRPETVQKITLGADKAGKLTAVRHEVTAATSRFDEFLERSAMQTRMLYACPNVQTSHRVVQIDAPTPTFQRAPGYSTGTFAIEVAMDELAWGLKVDPVELRLRNYAEKDPGTGKPWSSKVLRQCYRQAADRFGWRRWRPEVRANRDGHALVGWGMATAVYPSHVSTASAVARVRPDGEAIVQAGSQDIGTGTYTIMTQVAADALAMPIERVRFELGDTTFPETPVSGGSQTAASVGSAVTQACRDLRAKLVQMAIADPGSPLHGLRPDEIDADQGALVAKRAPAKKDPYTAIVHRSGQPEISAQAQTKESEDRKRFTSYAFGAQFAEVHVDEDLGMVRVTRWVGAFGAGKILNAKTARSQYLGGIVWGIGLALHEHTVRDARTARVVTRDLADYHVPVNLDVPPIDVIMVPEDDPHVSLVGAKGIGEIGITGAGAAIANAVYHATGKRIRALPITLDKLI